MGGGEQRQGPTRERRRAVWQRRFWEHTVRDEDDLARHADYLHDNPVRHNLAQSVRVWPWSSFHRRVQLGHCPPNWGRDELAIELGYEGAE
ncbi:MAG: hypothetical protein DWQ37_20960 [Planctomycetota bacterium]|nr:MAG: hypothetical protein DWQ37_20960 [Planctomycetota bacterium]